MRITKNQKQFAVALVRRSTDKVGQQENSLSMQAARISSFCEKEGLLLISTFIEDGISGAREVAKRSVLKAALDQLNPNTALVVYDRTRLCRGVHSAQLIERAVAKKKSTILSACGSGNGDSPTEKLMKNILDSYSEFERNLLASRITDGLANRKANMKRFTKDRYGLDVVGEDLIKNERECAILNQLMTLRDVEGLSFGKISRRFNMFGLTTKRGCTWTPQSVCSLYKTEKNSPILT